MPLFYLAASWIAGTYLASRWRDLGDWGAVAAAPLAALALLLAWRPSTRRGVLPFLCACLALLAAYRYASHAGSPAANDVSAWNGSTAQVRGVVAAPPESTGTRLRARLDVREVASEGEWRQVSGGLLVYLPPFPEYGYGDRLVVEGDLAVPPSFPDFDYREYLAQKGIRSQMRYPRRVYFEGSGQGDPWREALYDLRARGEGALEATLPEPQASLAKGILLGVRGDLPQHLQDDFAASGTTHIIAISGFNVSLVCGMMMAAASRLLGRRRAFLPVLSAIALYALLTGANPPVVRAAIMAGLALTAAQLGRQSSGVVALALSGAVMVGLNPRILWDVSFQLSFLAMAGLICAYPPLASWAETALDAVERRQALGPGGWLLRTLAHSLALTFAAILMTSPLIAYQFQRVSLIAPLANLLAQPWLGPVMVLGGATATIGLISHSLAQVFAWLTWPFLTAMIEAVQLCARAPVAAVSSRGLPEASVWLAYGLLGALIWLLNRGPLPRLRAPAPVAVRDLLARAASLRPVPAAAGWGLLVGTAAAVWWLALATPAQDLRVSFLDVGQGDAILVQTASRHTVLIDGGPEPQALVERLSDRLPFWDRTIDLVVLTHPEQDHVGGLPEVLRRYRVRAVLETGLESDIAAYQDWLATVRDQGIPRYLAQAGQRIDLGDGAYLEELEPEDPLSGPEVRDANDHSLVLRLVYGRVRFLLAGDIGPVGEAALLSDWGDLKSAVLKVPHHGAGTSCSDDLVAAVDPLVCVISCDPNASPEHPAPETLARLEGRRVLITAQEGTIDLTSDGERCRLRTSR